MQKYSGEIDLPLSEAQLRSGIWAWIGGELFVELGGQLSDVRLLRGKSNRSSRVREETDADTEVAVRLSAPPNGRHRATVDRRLTPVGGQVRAGLGTIADSGGLAETFPDDYTLQWVRVDADGVSNPMDIAGGDVENLHAGGGGRGQEAEGELHRRRGRCRGAARERGDAGGEGSERPAPRYDADGRRMGKRPRVPRPRHQLPVRRPDGAHTFFSTNASGVQRSSRSADCR